MELNINTDKSVTLYTEETTKEIKKALAKAENLAKAWVETAVNSLGGEITPKNPIHWNEGNYITKLVMEDGKVAAVIGHKTRLHSQSKYVASKWVYNHVATFKIETSGFKWTQLYEGLSGEDVTSKF